MMGNGTQAPADRPIDDGARAGLTLAPRRPGPELSVVVPTRDRPVLLEACLTALAGVLRDGDEIIVVDSASRTQEISAVAERHGARFLRCEVAGASRARNAGWRSASHEIVAFVDDDVSVTPGWADALTATFAAHGAAFVTGGVQVPPEQEGIEHPVAITRALEPFEIHPAAGPLLGHSANLAVRRAALELVGGFDESLGAGALLRAAEDNDLFDRMLAAGLRGRFEPGALAFHYQWRSRPDLLRLDWAYGMGTGARIAKLLHTDRARAGRAAWMSVWDLGLCPMFRSLRDGYEFGALSCGLQVVATIAGVVRGATIPVIDGHFAPRRPLRRPGGPLGMTGWAQRRRRRRRVAVRSSTNG